MDANTTHQEREAWLAGTLRTFASQVDADAFLQWGDAEDILFDGALEAELAFERWLETRYEDDERRYAVGVI